MGKLPTFWSAAVSAAAFAMLTVACTGGDFAGVSGKGANLKKSSSDAADGGPEADAGPDSGNDTDGGPDSGHDSGHGDVDGNDYEGGDDSVDGDDSEGDPAEPDDLATSDDETKKKFLHDATIHRSKADNKFDLLVETMVKGKAVQTNTLHFKSNGQAQEGEVIHLACRNNKSTCLKITFVGKITQILGGSACTKVLSNSGKDASIFADTDGEGIIGSCLSGDDEQVEISCPDSTKLKVEACK